jgi:hypothetical protein
MVGTYRKFDKIMRMLGSYAPLLNNLAPGLGDIAGLGVRGVRAGGRFANAAYNSYSNPKKKNKLDRFMLGVKSGLNSLANWKSKNIDELSDKIQLRPESPSPSFEETDEK